MKTIGGATRCVGFLGALVVSNCSGGDLAAGGHGQGKDLGETNGAAIPADSPDFVAGIRLAHVNVSATHTVEFWETQPGNVLMVQNFDPGRGDARLDLGPQLLEAGGTFSGLYRKLKNDPNAVLSEELVAADEHRRHLPIRDASLPLPPSVPPLFPAANSPPTQLAQPSAPAAKPGALRVQDLPTSTGANWSTWDSSFCASDADGIDGSWCPSSLYGLFGGNVNETIFWEAEGNNQPGTPSDVFQVYQVVSGAWQKVYSLNLGGGKTVEITYVGAAATYEGVMSGTQMNYAERWRLSFPQVIPVATHPGDADTSWLFSGFSNDIQGTTHDTYNTWMSRTEEGISGPLYGVIGGIVATEDLGGYAPDRYEYEEPAAWQNQGWNHYGDIVFDNSPPMEGPAGYTGGFIFVSLSHVRGYGGIGVYDPQNPPHQDRGAVRVSGNELAWLALNPKNRQFYASKGYAVSIQRYTVTLPYSTSVSFPLPVVHLLSDISLVNGPIDGLQGGKVSRHGKLWVSALQGENAVVYGIDPYSAITETVYQAHIPMFSNPSLYNVPDIEVEGLDITDPNLSSDALIQSYRPGITGEIHVPVLLNEFKSDDGWSMLNFSVSDLDRL